MIKQVLSVEQMKHLQKVGLEFSETILYWARDVKTEPRAANYYGKWILVKGKGLASVGLTYWEYIPAYTLQDVLDLLPKQIGVEYIYGLCILPTSISYTQFVGGEVNDILFGVPIDEELIDAAYSMLCWCIEQEYVKANK